MLIWDLQSIAVILLIGLNSIAVILLIGLNSMAVHSISFHLGLSIVENRYVS